MTDFVVIGTDTDAGKTAFSLLWLHAFADQYGYWKPLETGDSDSATIRRLAPQARVEPSFARFIDPVAPPLAAAREGRRCPTAQELLAARPHPDFPLLIETFGSALSPLNEHELQAAWVRALAVPIVLVASSAVGAVGRSLQALLSLRQQGLTPHALVLVGPEDSYAITEIQKHHPSIAIFSVERPGEWTVEQFAEVATQQRTTLEGLRTLLNTPTETPDWLERDRQVVWHPYSSLQPSVAPFPVVAAQDEFLELADGRRIIDAVSSWWTILQGHRPRPLVDALHAAIERLDHVLFAGVTHPAAIELAEALLASTPWPTGGRVFYSDNGSTAIEVALKMAYQAWVNRGEPQRTLFVGFEHAYHGDTFGAMAVSRDRFFFAPFEPLLFRALQVPLDPEQLDLALKAHRGQVAAIIAEPLVQGAGGMRMYSPATLAELDRVAREHGVFVIIDEVMTGNRTGRRWAHQHAGISPDLICAAKTLAGGMMPLAATLAGPSIVEHFDTPDRQRTFFHGHSFTAHPLACAVGVVHERIVAQPAIHARAEAIGQFWEEQLGSLRGRPGIADVRICGSIVAVELDVPGGYLAQVGERIRAESVARGVLLRPLGNVVYAMPPLGSSQESLARIAEVLRDLVTS